MSYSQNLEDELSRILNRAPLAAPERDLARRCLIEALKSGTSCEIEQVIKRASDLSRSRIRAQAQIERDDADRIAEITCRLERDGEPILSWRWDARDFVDAEGEPAGGGRAAVAEIRNALCSIMFSAAAIRRTAHHCDVRDDVAALCELISANSTRLLDNVSVDRAFAL